MLFYIEKCIQNVTFGQVYKVPTENVKTRKVGQNAIKSRHEKVLGYKRITVKFKFKCSIKNAYKLESFIFFNLHVHKEIKNQYSI